MRIYRGKHRSKDIMVISYPLRRAPAFAALTPRELAVVEAVLDGYSQEAIAQRGSVAARTVANQLAGAYRKLGIGSAGELAALCSERAPGEPSKRK